MSTYSSNGDVPIILDQMKSINVFLEVVDSSAITYIAIRPHELPYNFPATETVSTASQQKDISSITS